MAVELTMSSNRVGMASALETLCGQAYGAERYQQVGNFTHAATLCLLVVCLLISILWVFADKLFIFIGQDPLISNEAGKYAIWLVPSLFAFVILQTLTLYLQIQKLMLPILLSSVASLLTNILLCWGSVFKLKLGSAGAALSIGISYWLNVALLLLYVKYSSACDKTHASFSKEVFSYVGKFFQYAVPSAMMVCLEWWCFELVILLSEILPNPQIEVNVMSISMTITALHFTIPNSFGAAARSELQCSNSLCNFDLGAFLILYALVYNDNSSYNTRISNELGAENPHAAQLAAYTAVILTVTEVLCSSCYFLLSACLKNKQLSSLVDLLKDPEGDSAKESVEVNLEEFKAALSRVDSQMKNLPATTQVIYLMIHHVGFDLFYYKKIKSSSTTTALVTLQIQERCLSY